MALLGGASNFAMTESIRVCVDAMMVVPKVAARGQSACRTTRRANFRECHCERRLPVHASYPPLNRPRSVDFPRKKEIRRAPNCSFFLDAFKLGPTVVLRGPYRAQAWKKKRKLDESHFATTCGDFTFHLLLLSHTRYSSSVCMARALGFRGDLFGPLE
jgi:hypothetical protein